MHVAVLQPRNCLNNYGLGYSPFARHYLGNHNCFLFLRVLRCFSSPGLPPIAGYQAFNLMSFLIRKSADIMGMCPSPQLIAAYHVLHRLWEPRHPPCALNYFLIKLRRLFSSSLSLVFSFNMSKNVMLKIHISNPKWRITDSNRWPPACKAGALASWANSPKTHCSPEQIWTADPYIISVVL